MRKSFSIMVLLVFVTAHRAFSDDLFTEVTIDSVYSTSGGSSADKPNNPSGGGRPVGGVDSLAGTLLGAGYSSKRVTDNVVSITVRRGELSLPVLVSVSSDGQKLWLGMMLSKIADEKTLPTDKLLKLLEANRQHGPASFVYSRNRGRIELHLALDNRGISSELVKTKLDELTDIAAKTVDLWNLGETPTAAEDSTEPTTEEEVATEAPAAVPAPEAATPAPKAESLAGTWIATRSETEAFALKINADGTFLLAYVKDKQSSKSQGKASFNGQILVLKGDDGTNLTGTVKLNGEAFTFTPTGANSSQSFNFKKA